jgi:arginine decarboxylase
VNAEPGRSRADGPRLAIDITGSTGRARTRLAAFDAALLAAGVANYNIIRLSSVIPPGSVVCASAGPLTPPGGWGDRLYVVAAEWRTDEAGEQAWAGIGWAQDPASGRGLFVEHEGPDEAVVRADIAASLAALRSGRGADGDALGDTNVVVQGITCVDEPVCALVVAVFAAEPWGERR